MNILVVDPDRNFRDSVTNTLLLCGIENFEVAGTGHEALEKIAKETFDFVLVDLFIPKMSGLQLAQQFKERMPKAKIMLLIEDEQQSALSSDTQTSLDFPTILKSFVSHTLPKLLSEESNPLSQKS